MNRFAVDDGSLTESPSSPLPDDTLLTPLCTHLATSITHLFTAIEQRGTSSLRHLPTSISPSALAIQANKAYSMTDADTIDLTHLLTTFYLASYAASHQHAAAHTNSTAQQPPQAVQQHAIAWSVQTAHGIAQTFSALLQHQIAALLPSSPSTEQQHTQEGIGSLIKGVISSIADWFSGLMGWKSDQIAQNTCNTGWDDGIDDYAEALVGSDILDRDTGQPVGIAQYSVQVVPETSSNDVCRQWAGRIVPMSEFSTIPKFPAHPFCPHYKIIARNS